MTPQEAKDILEGADPAGKWTHFVIEEFDGHHNPISIGAGDDAIAQRIARRMIGGGNPGQVFRRSDASPVA